MRKRGFAAFGAQPDRSVSRAAASPYTAREPLSLKTLNAKTKNPGSAALAGAR